MHFLPLFLRRQSHHLHRHPIPKNNTLFKMAQLPSLPEVTSLTPSVIRILAGNPSKFTLQGTNTYLVGSGQNRILIDTGEGKPSWITTLKSTLSSSSSTISECIITHWHHDHVGGIPDLLSAFPHVKIYKHRPDYHNPSGFPFLDIPDGQEFEVEGGGKLKAVHTPGHTEDHMVLQYSTSNQGEQGGLFTGDNVLGHGTTVFEDLSSYLTSLSKMKTLVNGKAYPGHGPVIEHGRETIEEYIRHRQQREDQVVQQLRAYPDVAVAGGQVGGEKGWTLMGLVRVIYKDIPESLHVPAAGGVVQILKKLEREGRVRVREEGVGEEDRWVLVEKQGGTGSGRGSAL
ncbi:putative metallo-beta-lactamase domain protein [Triangularia setosa]|uniref:Metallo-beta-lactamase domain protein n=1 Tax=Triangularia setosa TaxID=2587417 RepID=A0AAN7A4Y8_9PEZI|nr:putative metallo-beta-lactamase domain protein [Podospora setosa]